MNEQMTMRERTELARLIRQRERVAKADADRRGAELLADVEAQLARRYAFDGQATWKAAYEAANEASSPSGQRNWASTRSHSPVAVRWICELKPTGSARLTKASVAYRSWTIVKCIGFSPGNRATFAAGRCRAQEM